jgi:hypothetical protein
VSSAASLRARPSWAAPTSPRSPVAPCCRSPAPPTRRRPPPTCGPTSRAGSTRPRAASAATSPTCLDPVLRGQRGRQRRGDRRPPEQHALRAARSARAVPAPVGAPEPLADRATAEAAEPDPARHDGARPHLPRGRRQRRPADGDVRHQPVAHVALPQQAGPADRLGARPQQRVGRRAVQRRGDPRRRVRRRGRPGRRHRGGLRAGAPDRPRRAPRRRRADDRRQARRHGLAQEPQPRRGRVPGRPARLAQRRVGPQRRPPPARLPRADGVRQGRRHADRARHPRALRPDPRRDPDRLPDQPLHARRADAARPRLGRAAPRGAPRVLGGDAAPAGRDLGRRHPAAADRPLRGGRRATARHGHRGAQPRRRGHPDREGDGLPEPRRDRLRRQGLGRRGRPRPHQVERPAGSIDPVEKQKRAEQMAAQLAGQTPGQEGEQTPPQTPAGCPRTAATAAATPSATRARQGAHARTAGRGHGRRAEGLHEAVHAALIDQRSASSRSSRRACPSRSRPA